MEKPTCATCPFWDNDPISSNGAPEISFVDYPGADNRNYVRGGECHRLPPTTVVTSEDSWPDNAQGVFAITLPLDWCGEHPDFAKWLAENRPS